jgi:predicted nucleic acid-binding protein
VIVIDASVVTNALADDSAQGQRVRDRLRGNRLAAPELVDVEVLSALRGRVRSGAVDHPRAQLALSDLHALPLLRAPHWPLLERCWELRDNLTCYDAAYVALAELLDTTLLTADARLAKASGLRCAVEVLT